MDPQSIETGNNYRAQSSPQPTILKTQINPVLYMYNIYICIYIYMHITYNYEYMCTYILYTIIYIYDLCIACYVLYTLIQRRAAAERHSGATSSPGGC